MAPAAPPAPRSSLLLRLAFGAPDADAASHEVVVGDQTDAEPVAMQPSTPVRSERTVQLPPDTPGRTQQNPRSLSSTLRSDSIASCASTVLFAGDESSPRTPSKGALAATAAAAVASADLAAADVSAGLEEMDPSEREYLLRLLFERFAAHGKDREQAPHKQIALRSFGPARYGTLVHTLREDVRLYEGRLGAKSRNPPFVFSDFASRPKRDSSEPQLDSVHFAKLCRECGILDARIVDEDSMATSLTAVQADICFRKVLPKGHRSLSYELFSETLLPELARQKAMPPDTLAKQLVMGCPAPIATPRCGRHWTITMQSAPARASRPASAPLR